MRHLTDWYIIIYDCDCRRNELDERIFTSHLCLFFRPLFRQFITIAHRFYWCSCHFRVLHRYPNRVQWFSSHTHTRCSSICLPISLPLYCNRLKSMEFYVRAFELLIYVTLWISHFRKMIFMIIIPGCVFGAISMKILWFVLNGWIE